MAVKIYSSAQRRDIDALTIEQTGVSSAELMERAGMQCARWIMSKFSRSHRFYVFCGKGNNGGDGWVIARYLARDDYRVTVFYFSPVESFSDDTRLNYERANAIEGLTKIYVTGIEDIPLFTPDDVLIDALLGSGLNKPLEGFMAELVKYLNESQGVKIAIDIPTGLPGEGVMGDNGLAFKAHFTLTFQFPFVSFLFAENYSYVGEWVLIDIGLVTGVSSLYAYVNDRDIKLKTRQPFTYKNEWGHALLLAGSRGMMGAAILSARACLRSGVGLVTVHVPGGEGMVIHCSTPEAIVSFDENERVITHLPALQRYNAIAIGPGIGQDERTHGVVYKLIESANCPLVLDADALNILAQHNDWIPKLPENTILTPHPGEFDRLAGKSTNSWERFQKQLTFSQTYKVIVVLKGHYTRITLPDGRCYFNSTGNAGMATAGSGDVLTGIILSFLAQGYSAEEAAVYGVYMHGLAGDIAASKRGYESLVASDIIRSLGKAFGHIQNLASI